MFLRKKEITSETVARFADHAMAGDKKAVKKMLKQHGRPLAAVRNGQGQAVIVAVADRAFDSARERSKAYDVLCTLARGGAAAQDIKATEDLVWKNFPRYDFRSVAFTSIHDRWHDAKGFLNKMNHYLRDPVISLPSGYYSRAENLGLSIGVMIALPAAFLLVVGSVAGAVAAHAGKPAEEPKEVEPIIIRLKIEQVPPATTSFNRASTLANEVAAQHAQVLSLPATKNG